MIKKAFFLIVAIFLLGLLLSFGKQITDSLQAGQRLDAETEELGRLQRQNQDLKKKLAVVNTIGFVEEAARNKLEEARPGESVVIISQEAINQILNTEKHEETKLPNWQGWLRLFI